MPIFTHIFATDSLRQKLENRLFGWELSSPHVPCACNHSLNASLSLCTHLGLPPERVVSWDREPPKCDHSPRPLRAFYAGMIVETKGIRDCHQATTLLATLSKRLKIEVAGGGHLEALPAEAHHRPSPRSERLA